MVYQISMCLILGFIGLEEGSGPVKFNSYFQTRRCSWDVGPLWRRDGS